MNKFDLQQHHMSIEEKQSYLRQVILERGINPNEFFEYWQALDLQLQDIEFQKLKNIVTQFIQRHAQERGQREGEKEQNTEEEEFTDFQQPQHKHVENKVYSNQYADFNWDFLNPKSPHPKPTEPTVPSTLQKPKQTKKQPQRIVPKPEPMKKKEAIESKQGEKTTIKKMGKVPKQIQQLDEWRPKVQKLVQVQGNPKQQKTLTVRQVLQSSRLNKIKCLKLQQNVLSHHNNVQILITKAEQLEDKSNNLINKIIKNTYFLFTIKTIARNKNRSIGITWEVKRKPQDFQWLRNILIKFYPGLVVPPLPTYPKSKEKVFGYQKKLQNFLLDCYRCPELKNSKYYEVFLSYSASADFQTFMKNSEGASKPKSLNHILNMSGVVETLYSKNIEQYGVGLQGYLNKTSQHLKQVKSILTEINDAYSQISLSYKKLGNVFMQMSDQSHSFSDQACYQRLANTYKQIAFLSNEHSNFCQGQKDFIDAFMQSHFAYEKDRLDNMQSLISKRILFASQLSKRPKQQENKSTMFGKIASFFGQKMEYVDTPSSNYQTLSNQVGYYNNQLLRQSVRCVDVMIESHINHFSGYGHTRIDNVDKMQMIWSNMLVELSKLNSVKRQ